VCSCRRSSGSTPLLHVLVRDVRCGCLRVKCTHIGD
jgi:hypothetical protein